MERKKRILIFLEETRKKRGRKELEKRIEVNKRVVENEIKRTEREQ